MRCCSTSNAALLPSDNGARFPADSPLQLVPCALCGIDHTITIAKQNEYKVVKCTECGLVYVNPRPSPEALIRLYRDYHQRDGKDEWAWARLMRKNFREVAVLLNRMHPQKGTMLDIGCGYGHFVEKMKDCGWCAAGIDPSPRTVAWARRRGLNVIETTIDEAAFPEDSFQAVTMFYVLEHLSDPLAALVRIRRVLKRKGSLILRIPHTTPIVRLLSLLGITNNLYDTPFHLYDFSPQTATLLLEKAGFCGIRVTPGSPTLPERSVERLISLSSGYLSMLLFLASGGSVLLPGTSKTIIASKPD